MHQLLQSWERGLHARVAREIAELGEIEILVCLRCRMCLQGVERGGAASARSLTSSPKLSPSTALILSITPALGEPRKFIPLSTVGA